MLQQRPHRSVWVKRNKFKTVGWTPKNKKTKTLGPNNVLKDASQTQTRRRDDTKRSVLLSTGGEWARPDHPNRGKKAASFKFQKKQH